MASKSKRTSATKRPSTAQGSPPKKQRRGFAAMSPEKQREIARQGGSTISRDRKHMAKIGRRGGANSHLGDSKAA